MFSHIKFLDDVSGVVLDIGSFYSRGGYSGEDAPRMCTPSAVGVLEAEGHKNFYVDEMVRKQRDKMVVNRITDANGYINDYDGLDAILRNMLNDRLGIEPKEHPLLLTEPSLHNKEHRLKFTSHLFEKYQVPALFICKSAVLSAFSCGRSTSLVLESGANSTYAVPVHDGYALQASMIKCDIGGNYLSKLVKDAILAKVGKIVPSYGFTKKTVNGQIVVEYLNFDKTDPTLEEFDKNEIIRDCKESVLSLTTEAAMEITDAKTGVYELPDGTKVDMESDRKKIPEVMFTGSPEFPNFTGVHRMISDAIVRADLDIRKELYNNVVVAGGNTLIQGFVDRIQKILPDIASPNVKVKVIAHMPSERKFSAWIGGSILSSLGSFQQMWMSRQEFEEHGAIMIERKCA